MRGFGYPILLALIACQSGAAPGVEQFRAWCWSKSRPLGDWTTDRAKATGRRIDLRLYPHHRADVKVWTGPLSATGADG